jgi:glycosyltransferase involved in cell wall biosynthesis
MSNKIALILSTHKRLDFLENTLNTLLNQTYKNFDIFISHNGLENKDNLKKILEGYDKKDYTLEINDNSFTCFQRHFLAKKLAENNYKIIFILDDDVFIPKNYIEEALAQYEPKSYKSGYAHSFISNPPDYNKRRQCFNSNKNIGYCGTGMSIIDSSLFLDPEYFNQRIIDSFNMFDDIWISLFCLKKGWKLDYLHTGAVLNGDDDVATYKKIMKHKNVFLNKLLKSGYSVPVESLNEQ